jgi:hypothetical protein
MLRSVSHLRHTQVTASCLHMPHSVMEVCAREQRATPHHATPRHATPRRLLATCCQSSPAPAMLCLVMSSASAPVGQLTSANVLAVS